MRKLAALGICLVASGMAQMNETGPIMNKEDLSYKGSQLITGDYCDYTYHEEWNLLKALCVNDDGILVGHQMR
jgi:hypothetical protein